MCFLVRMENSWYLSWKRIPFPPADRQVLYLLETVVGSGHALWGAGLAQLPSKSSFVVGETQSSHIQDALV